MPWAGHACLSLWLHGQVASLEDMQRKQHTAVRAHKAPKTTVQSLILFCKLDYSGHPWLFTVVIRKAGFPLSLTQAITTERRNDHCETSDLELNPMPAQTKSNNHWNNHGKTLWCKLPGTSHKADPAICNCYLWFYTGQDWQNSNNYSLWVNERDFYVMSNLNVHLSRHEGPCLPRDNTLWPVYTLNLFLSWQG